MHIADLSKGMLGANAIVGGSPPLAVGAALAAKTLKNNAVAVAFIGDGASNQGTVFEAMNLAVVLKLPVIFIYENNGYAEFTGIDYHCGAVDITTRSSGFGMPAVKVDGTDFFAVHDVMREAVERARSGDGPTSIECEALRWYGHYEGDPQAYRSKTEVKEIKANKDPLEIFKQKVLEKELIENVEFEEINSLIEKEVDDAIKLALNSPVPPLSSLEENVYESY